MKTISMDKNEPYINQNKLLVFYLFQQITLKVPITDQYFENIRPLSQFIPLYFKVMKKNQMLTEIYRNNVFSSCLKYLNKTKKINTRDELIFVFNFIEYLLAFNIQTYTIDNCYQALVLVQNEMGNKTPKEQFFFYYYNLKVKLCRKDLILNQEEIFATLEQLLEFRSEIDHDFLYFLLYSLLNLSFARSIFPKLSHISFSVKDLFSFIWYSFSEMKLVECEVYIKMESSFSNLTPSEKRRMSYYSDALHLLQMKQKKIKLDPESTTLVGTVNNFILTTETERKKKIKEQLIVLINRINSKDNNCLVLNVDIIEGGNESILKQIQQEYLTPLRLLELVTNFYNNLLILKVEEYEHRFVLIEKLIYYIARRNQAKDWQVLLHFPLFYTILFKIVQWYIYIKYESTKAKYYYEIVIMHKLFDKLLRTYNLEKMFKKNRLTLLKKKADAYYKLNKYAKAKRIFIMAKKEIDNSRDIEKDIDEVWRVNMKICLCCLKLYDNTEATNYFIFGEEKFKEKMKMIELNKKLIKKSELDYHEDWKQKIETIKKYLCLNSTNSNE